MFTCDWKLAPGALPHMIPNKMTYMSIQGRKCTIVYVEIQKIFNVDIIYPSYFSFDEKVTFPIMDTHGYHFLKLFSYFSHLMYIIQTNKK